MLGGRLIPKLVEDGHQIFDEHYRITKKPISVKSGTVADGETAPLFV